MGVAEQEELVGDVFRALDSDFAVQLCEHPDFLAFPQSSSRVVPQLPVLNHRVEKAEALMVLHSLVTVPDNS